MYFSSSTSNKRNIAEAVLMVKPVDFCFNEESADDNKFMNKVQLTKSQIRDRACQEFDGYVEKLRAAGCNVLTFDKDQYHELKDLITPDACFPNNWFATSSSNLIYTFNMYAPSRKAEKKTLPYIEKLLVDQGFSFKGVTQIGSDYKNARSECLEGTGSMIIDHNNQMVYACRSLRTCESAFKDYLELTGYKGVLFDALSSTGFPFYHTNMIMCVGQHFITICLESIVEEHREIVMNYLKASGKEIIDLSFEQVEKHCCGNILEIRSKKTEENIVAMSERAYKAFTHEQKAKIEKRSKIVYANIDTIEEVGGGSARCMLAEIFLENKGNSESTRRSSAAQLELSSPLTKISSDMSGLGEMIKELKFSKVLTGEIASPEYIYE